MTSAAIHSIQADPLGARAKVEACGVSLYYGTHQALKTVDLRVPERKITALIGPSGCGKSTFLRCLNRMNDLIDGVRIEGTVLLDGVDIYDRGTDIVELRRRVGMVFQTPNPFPMTIYDNIAYGPRLHGLRDRAELDTIVERSLRGRRPLGRGQGQADRIGLRSVGGTTAEALHRPRASRRARSASDGRAL